MKGRLFAAVLGFARHRHERHGRHSLSCDIAVGLFFDQQELLTDVADGNHQSAPRRQLID